MHVGYGVKVEWGIGGEGIEMETINEVMGFHKSKYSHLLHATSILTNFLHKCQMDLTYKIIGDQIEDPTKYA
jgi:hypothetical protein